MERRFFTRRRGHFSFTICRAMSSLGLVFMTRSRAVGRLVLLLALAAFVALALREGGAALQTGALMMTPVFALAVLMLTRPYIGERILARLAVRRPRRREGARSFGPLWVMTQMARGGQLIAAALAGRAPPRLLAGYH